MCERRQQTGQGSPSDWGRADSEEEMMLTVCLVSSVLWTYEFSCSLMILYVYTYLCCISCKNKRKNCLVLNFSKKYLENTRAACYFLKYCMLLKGAVPHPPRQTHLGKALWRPGLLCDQLSIQATYNLAMLLASAITAQTQTWRGERIWFRLHRRDKVPPSSGT